MSLSVSPHYLLPACTYRLMDGWSELLSSRYSTMTCLVPSPAIAPVDSSIFSSPLQPFHRACGCRCVFSPLWEKPGARRAAVALTCVPVAMSRAVSRVSICLSVDPSVCLPDGLSAYLPSGWALQPIWRVGYFNDMFHRDTSPRLGSGSGSCC